VGLTQWPTNICFGFQPVNLNGLWRARVKEPRRAHAAGMLRVAIRLSAFGNERNVQRRAAFEPSVEVLINSLVICQLRQKQPERHIG